MSETAERVDLRWHPNIVLVKGRTSGHSDHMTSLPGYGLYHRDNNLLGARLFQLRLVWSSSWGTTYHSLHDEDLDFFQAVFIVKVVLGATDSCHSFNHVLLGISQGRRKLDASSARTTSALTWTKTSASEANSKSAFLMKCTRTMERL